MPGKYSLQVILLIMLVILISGCSGKTLTPGKNCLVLYHTLAINDTPINYSFSPNVSYTVIENPVSPPTYFITLGDGSTYELLRTMPVPNDINYQNGKLTGRCIFPPPTLNDSLVAINILDGHIGHYPYSEITGSYGTGNAVIRDDLFPGLSLQKVESDGAVYLLFNNETIKLAPGEEHVFNTSWIIYIKPSYLYNGQRVSLNATCERAAADHVKNMGIIDNSNVNLTSSF